MRLGQRPADRTAATALFLGGGWVSRGPRGSVNSSEVCMLRERHPGSRRGRSRGTPPGPTERGHTGRAAVDAPSLSFIGGGRGAKFLGRICFFITVFFCFLFFIFSSQKCPQYLCTRKRGWGGPFDLSLRKCLKFPECCERSEKMSSDSFVVMGYEVKSGGGQTSPEVLKLRM